MIVYDTGSTFQGEVESTTQRHPASLCVGIAKGADM